MPTLEQIREPWPLQRLKDAYETYLDLKVAEIEEQRLARRYYHGAQLTDGQRKAIEQRGLAPVIFNRIGPKIDEFGGTLERLKQDPKAYPRTQGHQEAADFVTETLRFELDEEDFNTLAPAVAKYGAIDGIGCCEMELQPSGRGEADYDIKLKDVDPADYFYDPRTFKLDFSDCSYDGVGRWFTLEDAVAMYPDKAELLGASTEDATELTSNPDKDRKWFTFSSRDFSIEKVRICECWYRHGDGYRWAIFTGSDILFEGEGYFYDPRGKQISKYISFAANRDQDGDAYGFIRSMKYAQDEINAWKMGLNYDILSRRIIIQGDDPQNVEKIRKEWARKDGTVILPNGASAIPDDKTVDINGAINAIAEAKGEIDRYGFDSGLLGENPDLSGRAIERLNAAGLARLGPYLIQYKDWKIRVYRALWAQIQRYWTAERFIRVTDDEGIAQFVQVNTLGIDPMTGVPVLQNALGELDVDIIIEEGPDVINAMQQTTDDLRDLARNGQDIPAELFIEASPIDAKTKRKWTSIIEERRKAASQPDPIAQAAAQTEIAIGEATANDLNSRAAKNMAEIEEKRSPLTQAEQFADVQKKTAEAERASAQAAAQGGDAPSFLDEQEQVARIAKLASEAQRTRQPQAF